MTTGENKRNAKKYYSSVLKDTSIVIISVLIAVLLVRTGILSVLLTASQGLGFVSSFVTGFFFTSIFTTAPAIAAFGEITLTHSLFYTALFGALGAMCGDYIIFKFVRDTVSEHILLLTRSKSVRHRFKMLFKLRFFRWFTFFLGGLIIASPLPDEVGLSLMGFSNIQTKFFLPISFAFNFIGILAIGITARALF